MTKAMPFLQKAILLSYDPRRLGAGFFSFAFGVSMPGLIFKSRMASLLTGAC